MRGVYGDGLQVGQGDPHVRLGVRIWKQVLRPVGVIAAFLSIFAVFGHYTKYGPKEAASSEEKSNE